MKKLLCVLMLLVCLPVCGGGVKQSKVYDFKDTQFKKLSGSYYKLASFDGGYSLMCGYSIYAEMISWQDLAFGLFVVLNDATTRADCKSWNGCKDEAKRVYTVTYIARDGATYSWACRVMDWQSFAQGEIPTTDEFFDNYVYVTIKPK